MPPPPTTSTLDTLWRSADPAAVAVHDRSREPIFYRELGERIERAASALRAAGMGAGDVVGIVLPNGVDFLVAFLAVTSARAVAAPLNPSYTAAELAFSLGDARARAVLAAETTSDALAAAASASRLPVWTMPDLETSGASARLLDAPSPNDVALFLHTSGTTSRPKGVPLTQGALMASLDNIVATYALSADDRSVVVMPLFHVHGLIGVTLSTLRSGGTLALPPRFSASSFWEEVRALGATWYSAVPTIHQILLQRARKLPDEPARLRFIRSCSASLPPATLRDVEASFDAPVLEAYGMTEAAHQVASNPLPPAAHRPGSVGLGTGVEVTIRDERGQVLAFGAHGEVCVRGPNVMLGYQTNDEARGDRPAPDPNIAAFFPDGWFRTGDQGVLGPDGYLSLTGRIKELINRGGEKISPLEVDAVLLEHPAVAEAVCFAVPHDKYGEEVEAVVVTAPGTAIDLDDVARFCLDRLAGFKVPKRIHLTDAIPRTATGKVQRRFVAAAFREVPGGRA
ncbi:MAG: AMP-binding protein [Actinobacteria bacterium]|nr:AMP-binding protein [Actinomycetota bacterium]